ncbi:MAG: hypothetical protein AB1486_27380 [Planctomycetota bacterium]
MKGFRLQVRDPTGAAFRGTARSAFWKCPASAPPGGLPIAIDLPETAGVQAQEFGGLELTDDRGSIVARVNPYQLRAVPVSEYHVLLDGDPRVPAKAQITEFSSSPDDPMRPPFVGSWRVDYEFGEGWRFLRLVPESSPGTAGMPIEGRPSAVGAWVFGDASELTIRSRLLDSAGQTFQTTGPAIDWKGWRWVTMALDRLATAEHWGGPDDGIPRPPFFWECALLFDGPRTRLSGTIYVSLVAAIYREG